jgi:hypothetical protein
LPPGKYKPPRSGGKSEQTESYGSSPKRNCFSYPPLAGTIASIDELFDA